MKTITHKTRGFTLIELLVVVSIISLVSSVVTVAASTSKRRSVDARVVAERHQVQTALELYATEHNGGYPNAPANASGANQPPVATAFCVGSDTCVYTNANGNRIDVTDRLELPFLPDLDPGPVFSTEDGDFQGFVYLTCAASTDDCPPGSAVLFSATYDQGYIGQDVGTYVPILPATVTATAGAGGTITPSGVTTLDPNSTIEFTITPQNGYSISGVTVDGAPVAAASPYVFTNINGAHTIHATFSQASYTISQIVHNGYHASDSYNVASGQSIDIFAAHGTGYEFDYILVDGAPANLAGSYDWGDKYTFTNVQANHTIEYFYKLWTPDYYITTSVTGDSAGTPACYITPGSPNESIGVKRGDNLTVSVTCSHQYGQLYLVDAVYVNGENMGPISSYDFNDIQSNHTFEVHTIVDPGGGYDPGGGGGEQGSG